MSYPEMRGRGRPARQPAGRRRYVILVELIDKRARILFQRGCI